MFKKTEQKPESEYFVFFDSKVGIYGDPVKAINKHDLLRQIDAMFRDPKEQQKNQLFTNAEDFQLFKIGEYSKSTGDLVPTAKEHVANLHEIKSAVLRSLESQTRPLERSVN